MICCLLSPTAVMIVGVPRKIAWTRSNCACVVSWNSSMNTCEYVKARALRTEALMRTPNSARRLSIGKVKELRAAPRSCSSQNRWPAQRPTLVGLHPPSGKPSSSTWRRSKWSTEGWWAAGEVGGSPSGFGQALVEHVAAFKVVHGELLDGGPPESVVVGEARATQEICPVG